MIHGYTTIPEIRLEFIEINKSHPGPPVVWIPGMAASAEQVAPFIKSFERHTIVLSLRGRGNSSSPIGAYSFINHLADIDAVVTKLELDSFFIFGHSVGACYAMGYAAIQYPRIKGLIIGDYPTYYPKFSPMWVERVKSTPSSSLDKNIVSEFLNGTSGFSLLPFLKDVPFPILLLIAERNSLVSERQLSFMKNEILNLRVEKLAGSEHNFLPHSSTELVSSLERFIKEQQ